MGIVRKAPTYGKDRMAYGGWKAFVDKLEIDDSIEFWFGNLEHYDWIRNGLYMAARAMGIVIRISRQNDRMYIEKILDRGAHDRRKE